MKNKLKLLVAGILNIETIVNVPDYVLEEHIPIQLFPFKVKLVIELPLYFSHSVEFVMVYELSSYFVSLNITFVINSFVFPVNSSHVI